MNAVIVFFCANEKEANDTMVTSKRRPSFNRQETPSRPSEFSQHPGAGIEKVILPGVNQPNKPFVC